MEIGDVVTVKVNDWLDPLDVFNGWRVVIMDTKEHDGVKYYLVRMTPDYQAYLRADQLEK